MSGFDPFAPSPVGLVAVDVYTDSYRISGRTASRFARVGDIVNQATSSHMVVQDATISEYADAGATVSAMQVLVDLSQALLVIAAESGEAATRSDMRIPKRAVRAQVGLPPFRLTGSVHVPHGSRPADGVLNASDRFLPMTEVTIACGSHPELARTAAAVAFQRSRAQVILVSDDEHPDQLLADVLDAATAERWLKRAREGEGT